MEAEHTREFWISLARRSVDRLADLVGHGLRPDDGEFRPDDFDGGFSIKLRSVRVGTRPFDFGIRAVVGAQEGDAEPLVRAWLFVYFDGRRVAIDSDRPLLLMTYSEAQRAPETGVWRTEGWEYEEHGEFDSFLCFQDPGG